MNINERYEESKKNRDIALVRLKKVSDSLAHTITNLVASAKVDAMDRIKVHTKNPDGSESNISSRKVTMHIRNLLYGGHSL